jgi:hypothetical protein
MSIVILSMMIGSVLTYLATIISSAIKASTILEDAMLTYALLIMSAYEVSINQLEKAIVSSQIPNNQADVLRRINKDEFKKFANQRISEVVKNIPTSHKNIIRYKNFGELETYIREQYRSNYAKLK